MYFCIEPDKNSISAEEINMLSPYDIRDEYAYSEAREAVERNIEDECRTEINEERERMCY